MSSQRPPDIYVRNLILEGQGYPLWLPGPAASGAIPDDYKRDGTQIGDLGYLDLRGSFVYLFNVGKAINDPVNAGRTPPGFVPLPRIHDLMNQHEHLRSHANGYIFNRTSNETKSSGAGLSAGASAVPVALSAGVDTMFNFTSSSTEGVYLALPDGSSYSRCEPITELQEYAEKHAHKWYEFFNGEKYMQIYNGRLYLVTGREKCRSWANACYSHPSNYGEVSLRLKGFGPGASAGAALHYSWESRGHNGVHYGSHPEPPASSHSTLTLTSPIADEAPHHNANSGPTENQTIFLHGYSISVRWNLRRKKKVDLIKIDESKTKSPEFSSSFVPYTNSTTQAATETGTSSGTAQGHGAGTRRGTDDEEVEHSGSEVPESSEDESESDTSEMMDIPYSYATMRAGTGLDEISNPSALINKRILDTHPGATIALTHDAFKWTGMENNIRNPLNVMELAKYAIVNNLVSINKSETTPNAWVAKRQDTDIGVGTFPGQADIYFRDTLSAFTETGQAESSIEVPMQRSYSGRDYDPVISSRLADTPCATLGVQGVLDRLNATLGTSHTLHTADSSSASTASPAPSSAASVQDQLSLLSILEDFIEKKYDFGTAYAFLRPVWTYNPSNIQDELRRREGEDRKRRQKALVGNRIVDPHLTPRRAWDLYSNRVVPLWITYTWPRPISHAWVDEKDRVDVRTPINGKKWPVPIPKGADLNLIRIEMLNLGAEYAWLDVLCLRQKEEGGSEEDLRVEEWRLDVPTIGGVYNNGWMDVVIYLNGLGRPLKLKDGDLDSDRSWFRRAWTLQEVGYSGCIIAGDTPDGPMHAQQIDGRNYETALLTRFHKELELKERRPHRIFAALADMQKRVSTNPVDRVAGLAFRLQLRTLPVYCESETPEDAWTALVNAMDPVMRMHLLLLYPGVGDRGKKWRPTWDQVMRESLPEDVYFRFGGDLHSKSGVQHDDETDDDWFDGLYIEKGLVRVFDAGSAEGRGRRGKLVVKTADGIPYTFNIHVTHQFPIPEDTYTLLSDTDLSYHWAIGRQLPDGKFEKVSVIVVDKRDKAYSYNTAEGSQSSSKISHRNYLA